MKFFIVLAVVLLLAAMLKWAFWPGRGLPRSRVRFMRIRLHLRLHPGRGFATTWELWLRWGRLASLRRSGRIRRSLSFVERAGWPQLHSIWLGRAQYRHRLRVPLEEHVLVMAPPRTFKTAFLADVILHYPGPVISTTTKADVFAMTSGIRAALMHSVAARWYLDA
jgi:type IV secretion system protein VirD4